MSLLGNAHPVADKAFLLAPRGARAHLATPATLAPEELEPLMKAPFDPALIEKLGMADLAIISFLNIGLLAAQSKRHPHLQLIGFAASSDLGRPHPSDIERAIEAGLPFEVRGLPVVVPREPTYTAEIWVPVGDGIGACIKTLCCACEAGISGCYNLVHVMEPSIIRLIPRGLSERAGLELSCPKTIASVIAASPEESFDLWQSSLKGV